MAHIMPFICSLLPSHVSSRAGGWVSSQPPHNPTWAFMNTCGIEGWMDGWMMGDGCLDAFSL